VEIEARHNLWAMKALLIYAKLFPTKWCWRVEIEARHNLWAMKALLPDAEFIFNMDMWWPHVQKQSLNKLSKRKT
jgi:hypothetical protein